jgi:tetratricopeptide (TPR) repeat protein
MLRISLILASCLSLTTFAGAQQDLKKSFETLEAQGDRPALVAFWQKHPGRALGIIDSYLEGGLKILEGEAPDKAKVQAMFARAVRGAASVDEAFGTSIFTDYATSFVGWTPAQQKRFRAGQKAFGAYRQAMRNADGAEKALGEASRCLDLARPLGDWWGMAMGHTGRGMALEKLGRYEEALAAQQEARQIYHSFRLSSELGNLRAMARLLVKLERWPRARVTIERALIQARSMGRRGERAIKELEALQKGLPK